MAGRLKHRIGIALIGTALFWAAAAQAALEGPKRPFAKLDPPWFKALPFHRGELTGWYAAIYVGERRIVCANPVVWDGPAIITCDNVVAVDFEKRPGAMAEDPAGSPVGRR